MCEPGNGTKPPAFRKSKTLRPRRGVTMQIWPRQSKQSFSWMQRFWLCSSAARRVCRTRSSIRDASRYYRSCQLWSKLEGLSSCTFGTARIIFTATSLRLRISNAFTTLPKVPWPRSCIRLYRSPNLLFSLIT